MPIGLVVADGPAAFEAIAQDNGPALRRELEIAELLSHIKHRGIRNTVWLTADVHFCAAHYYDPNHARYQDFEPFWEFVGGPLHADSFPPNALDDTFGPQVRFVKGPTTPNQPRVRRGLRHRNRPVARAGRTGAVCCRAPCWGRDRGRRFRQSGAWAKASGAQEVVELAKLAGRGRAIRSSRDGERFAAFGPRTVKLAGRGAGDRQSGLVRAAVASSDGAWPVA